MSIRHIIIIKNKGYVSRGYFKNLLSVSLAINIRNLHHKPISFDGFAGRRTSKSCAFACGEEFELRLRSAASKSQREGGSTRLSKELFL